MTNTLCLSPVQVFPLKRRTFLWPTLPAVIELRRGNVGMPEPLLHPRSVSKTSFFRDSTLCSDCIAGFVGVDWLSRQGYNGFVIMAPLRSR